MHYVSLKQDRAIFNSIENTKFLNIIYICNIKDIYRSNVTEFLINKIIRMHADEH